MMMTPCASVLRCVCCSWCPSYRRGWAKQVKLADQAWKDAWLRSRAKQEQWEASVQRRAEKMARREAWAAWQQQRGQQELQEQLQQQDEPQNQSQQHPTDEQQRQQQEGKL